MSKRFLLVVEQEGDGCDHSIGCGTKVIELRADSLDGALVEARDEHLIVEDDDYYDGGSGYLVQKDIRIRRAYIVATSPDMEIPTAQWTAEFREKRSAQQAAAQAAVTEAADRTAYERLRAKFEGK